MVRLFVYGVVITAQKENVRLYNSDGPIHENMVCGPETTKKHVSKTKLLQAPMAATTNPNKQPRTSPPHHEDPTGVS